MITNVEVWNALTDGQRYARLLSAEAVRDLLSRREGHHTSQAEWLLLNDQERYVRLTDTEADKDNWMMKELADLHRTAPVAVSREEVLV